MAILFRCGTCNTRLQATNQHGGRQVKCPKCHVPLQIPLDSNQDGASPRIKTSGDHAAVVTRRSQDLGSAHPFQTNTKTDQANPRLQDAVIGGRPGSRPAQPPPDPSPTWQPFGALFSDEELRPPSASISEADKPSRSDANVLQGYLKDIPLNESTTSATSFAKPPISSEWLILILMSIGFALGLVLAVLLSLTNREISGGAFLFLPPFTACVLVYAGGVWRLYEKAGFHGIVSLIPIYNVVVLHDIAGVSPWYMLMWVFPVLNWIALFILFNGLARSFGRGPLFACGLFLFPFLFLPILGYGNDQYS